MGSREMADWRGVFGAWDENRGAFAVDYCDGPRKEWLSYQNDEDGDKFQRLWIECSDELAALGIMPDADGDYHWKPGESPLRWRSPLYMPRIASRITLEITNVRIQRLTEISVSEIAAEGWERREDITNNEQVHAEAALDWFTDLWESAHGPDSLSKNPYVWVIEFERKTREPVGQESLGVDFEKVLYENLWGLYES